LHKAQALAEQYNGLGVPLTSIAEYLPKADIVISSTAAPLPIIGKGMVERALKQRKHRPIFMVDIAVPRDIEPEVSELDDIYLYTVDDLQSVIEENLQSRREAAAQAEEMVVAEVGEFAAWLRAQQHMQLIRDYRQQNDQTRQEVLSKAKHMLDNQHPAEEVLEFLAHTLTNKLTHAPTQALNHAARVGDYAQLEYARKLFNLTDRD
jgi:glutamyl-tRNA reductase